MEGFLHGETDPQLAVGGVVSPNTRYSLGAALRNPCVKKRGPDLARRQAKKNTEPRRV